jgi:hypothetical protein
MLLLDLSDVIFEILHDILVVKRLILFFEREVLSFDLDRVSVVNMTLSDLIILFVMLFQDGSGPLIAHLPDDRASLFASIDAPHYVFVFILAKFLPLKRHTVPLDVNFGITLYTFLDLDQLSILKSLIFLCVQ